MRIHSLLRFTVFAVVFFRLSTSAALDLPPDVAAAFRQAATSEDGYLYSPGSGRELVIDYVRTHWKELLDHLNEVPSRTGTARSAAMVVGLAAEEMPPMEYLDFLDHYLTIYSKGGIKDEVLRSQLSGVGRKNDFIVVNSAHPKVRALLLRAKELVPKDNAEFQKYLDDEITGGRSDMYLANKSDDALPPETLPGIKLRTPFESLIAKAHRMRKESDEATKRERPARNAAGETGTAAAEPDAGSDGWKVWIFAAALALLLFSAWKGVFKRLALRKGTS